MQVKVVDITDLEARQLGAQFRIRKARRSARHRRVVQAAMSGRRYRHPQLVVGN
jgi:hypothetical protein